MDASFYEPKYKSEKIVAFADVDVAGGVIVKGFRVMRGERGLFASVPSRSFTVEGRTRYSPQVLFASPDVRARFLEGLLDAYRKWEESRSGAEPTGSSHPPADELVE
ncbi:MAG TPA: septation protein SpoVG family protein [Vicinamibacteria bacterium]|jgi:DNA-binding cell septation regulator SpoVG